MLTDHSDVGRHKRNYSYLHGDRIREQRVGSLSKNIITHRPANKSQSSHDEHSKILLYRQDSRTKTQENRSIDAKLEMVLPAEHEITDPQMVPEYFSTNLQFLRNKERENYRLINYLGHHGTVTENSRGKLIDWLSDLHQKFKMFPETIFSVVSIMDQYLSVKEVPISELQLVGVATLFLTSKFEETYQVPKLKHLVCSCAGLYTVKQILNMEADIIKELNFELIVNSSYKFFEPLSRVIGLEPKNHHLAHYVLELSMLQPRFLDYAPSLVASAAIYLIKKIRKSESSWNDLMTSIVGYKENELKTCAKELCGLLESSS